MRVGGIGSARLRMQNQLLKQQFCFSSCRRSSLFWSARSSWDELRFFPSSEFSILIFLVCHVVFICIVFIFLSFSLIFILLFVFTFFSYSPFLFVSLLPFVFPSPAPLFSNLHTHNQGFVFRLQRKFSQFPLRLSESEQVAATCDWSRRENWENWENWKEEEEGADKEMRRRRRNGGGSGSEWKLKRSDSSSLLVLS